MDQGPFSGFRESKKGLPALWRIREAHFGLAGVLSVSVETAMECQSACLCRLRTHGPFSRTSNGCRSTFCYTRGSRVPWTLNELCFANTVVDTRLCRATPSCVFMNQPASVRNENSRPGSMDRHGPRTNQPPGHVVSQRCATPSRHPSGPSATSPLRCRQRHSKRL